MHLSATRTGQVNNAAPAADECQQSY